MPYAVSVATAVAILLAAPFVSAQPATSPLVGEPEKFELKLQQSAEIRPNVVSVTFVGYRDHRCPTDVACLHAGHAFAFLLVELDSMAPKLVALTWPQSVQVHAQSNVAFGYRFCLSTLEPRPLRKSAVDPSSYRVGFSVELESRSKACKDVA